MDKETQAIRRDLGRLAEDARALVAATADVAGEKVAEARKRLAAALEDGKEIYDRLSEKAVDCTAAADKAVGRNIYTSGRGSIRTSHLGRLVERCKRSSSFFLAALSSRTPLA